ncbi:MAG TPA: tRNA epoxyqueuosine(34) reductase QueG [Thermoanaerobaculia bacterium]|nr:tRNA epoxyqueuosine(34) reductase QueG [Thermoanaerobaculia bacterium]
MENDPREATGDPAGDPASLGDGPGARSRLLRRWALEAGFDRAGVATLEPAATGEAFLRWLDRGEHATMGYLERGLESRLDPSRVLEDARSVLCVALVYHPLAAGEGGERDGDASAPVRPEPEGDLWPRVARYARGRDYHNLMGKRLRKLARRVREAFPGTETRWSVDTAPVLERELAARAGLGAVGKNTCLLSREMGSWFLLGELFLTLELAPAEPLADLCGRCTRCLDACPTGALPEPYRLDANRCISYWTIEHRGPVPEPMREAVGEWVFGCDVCQEVCPWNLRFEGRADRGGRQPADHPELALPPQRARLDLAGLLALSPAAYDDLFEGSPMKRARPEGLRRNAAVAMGNRGDARHVPALARALAGDPDPVVRSHAAWALVRIGGEAAERALAEAAERETDPGVRAEITAEEH